MNWQRARTDDKKHERKEAIYHAALSLFKRKGYDGVSFNGIAAEAGFTKSNMYRYFGSKEEIFLSIFSVMFEQWQSDLLEQLQTLEEETALKTFAKVWTESLLAYPQFLDLKPLLFIALEKNSAYEQLVTFKTLAGQLLYPLAAEVSRIYPDLDIEKAFKYLNLSYAATANYWAGNAQNDALKRIYQMDEFKMLAPDFTKDMTDAIEIIIRGLKAG